MSIVFGNKRLVGQQRAREQISRIYGSDRISHAYLISGPKGSGKTAFALAFAELINGISNLTELGEKKSSRKSSWFSHPDIHVFLPRPTSADMTDIRERLELLAEDPYEIVDFSQRPSLNDDSSKNLQAFYPISYFREDIRPVAKLKPNEGNRVIIIMSGVETMRKETANAFLKLLEEPNDRLMFILTTESFESLLPTITSRCQHIPLGTLSEKDVREGLIQNDGLDPDDAEYLARVSGGNYAMTRFFDLEKLRENRASIVDFLRASYKQDAVELSKMIQDWQSSNNIEGMVALTNLIEMYLRDLLIFRTTQNRELITNIDQADSVERFTGSLKEAQLEDMITMLEESRSMLRRNVNPKLIFITLSLRYSLLMRGEAPVISEEDNWKHLPAFVS